MNNKNGNQTPKSVFNQKMSFDPKNKYPNVVAAINMVVVLMNVIFSKVIFRNLPIGVLPKRQMTNNPIAAVDIPSCLSSICLNGLKSN